MREMIKNIIFILEIYWIMVETQDIDDLRMRYIMARGGRMRNILGGSILTEENSTWLQEKC